MNVRTLRLYSCAIWLVSWAILLAFHVNGQAVPVVIVAGLAVLMIVAERERTRRRREPRRT